MTNYKRYILGSALAVSAMANLHAQTYNDTVRTNTWSVFAQGGVSYFWKVRGGDFNGAHKRVSPDAAVGVKYNIRPWVRVGLKAEYTQVRAAMEGALRISEQKDIATTLNGNAATKHIITDRIQNTNIMHVAMADLNVDFNIMDIWHNRRAQKFNLWLGTGVGYFRGWNRNLLSFSTCEDVESKGDTYYNVESTDRIDSYSDNSHADALYIPLSLNAEWDITPRWTVGIYAEGKYLPLNKEITPKFMGMGGLKIAYNFVGKKVKTNKQLYYDALRANETLKHCCEEKEQLMNELADAKNANYRLQNDLDKARQEAAEANKLAATNAQSKTEGGHIVYFPVGGSKLTELEKIRLDDYVAECKKNGNEITLVGEASADGNASSNQKLSESRLKTVLSYLKKKGVSDVVISDSQAIGASQKGDAKHRRVVINEK